MPFVSGQELSKKV